MTTNLTSSAGGVEPPCVPSFIGLSCVGRMHEYHAFRPSGFTDAERDALRQVFRLERMKVASEQVKEAEASFTAMAKARLETYSESMVFPKPNLRRADLETLGYMPRSVSASQTLQVHVLAPDTVLNEALARVNAIVGAPTAAFDPLVQSAFLNEWLKDHSAKERETFPVTTLRAWLMPDLNAVCCIDAKMFMALMDVFKTQLRPIAN